VTAAQIDLEIPLVVDLDGTLMPADMLFESATKYITTNALALPRIAVWLAGGKANLKARLAERVELDVAILPYRQEVLAWLRTQHAKGRKLILATAGDRRYAQAIAAHLGIFDEVIASDGTNNLTSVVKTRALVERFGKYGFDYVADRRADEPVWESAATAYIVGGGRGVVGRVAKTTNVGHVFPTRPTGLIDFFRAVRAHQWAKNLLVFVPLALAQVSEPSAVFAAALAFLLFSVAASGVYLLNDLTDLEADRRHPVKRHRPLASGRLSLPVAWMLWPLFLLLPIVVGYLLLPPRFTLVLCGYVVLTIAYSLVFKSKPVLDVIVLGLLYTLRIIGGAAAIDVRVTFWFFGFSLFFFLSLALMKRCEEIIMIRALGAEGILDRRGYRASDSEPITALGVATGVVSVFILALYINDPAVLVHYQTPWLLWPLVPLMLYWISRIWLLVHRGEVKHDPVLFTLKDPASWMVGFLGAVVLVLATFLDL
jgi:4-hydroxybenzoate polyprenyltransferase/phosphoserine phosphatase